MDGLAGFETETVVNKGRKIVYIGRIGGAPAILETRHPAVTMDNIGDYTRRDHRIVLSNDIYQTGEIDIEQEVGYTLRCPASEEDVRSAARTYRYVSETYDEYLARRASFGACWMDEAADSPPGDSILDSEDFLVVRDRRDGSRNLVLIFKNSAYRTIRDIEDTGLLARAREAAGSVHSHMGVDRDRVCVYFDIDPECKRLHMKIADISGHSPAMEFGGWVVLADNAIKNLGIDRHYYRRRLHFIASQ